ncbi:MAG: sulfite exporter TauE/SafE family protein [Candidatus Rokubacteria bacterium]|nr:sulfite exporter TauE/SafE family protein [Candidatus Rokubacteria bacterium]
MPDLAWVGGLAGLVVASFIKGAIGFGFPTVATPLLALATDVRTAVVVLLLPNIVMDGIQILRRSGALAAVRRHAPLIVSGAVGTILGTQFLARVSPRGLLLALGVVILAFVLVSLARPAWRLRPGLERPLAPVVGLLAGTLGGVTNVFALPLAPYLYALGLPKGEFVRAIAIVFLVFKLTQFGAVWQVGLMERKMMGLSLGATAVALVAFRLGLWAQDRVPAEVFNRAVLGFLGLVSLAMLARALSG